jgi:hypothetical protein
MIVNADMARFVEKTVRDHHNFFVEDPSWAEDFTKNGMSCHQTLNHEAYTDIKQDNSLPRETG